MKSVLTIAILTLFLSSGCFHASLNSEELGKFSSGDAEALTIWALSDIQPRNDLEKIDIERAINDVNQNIKGVDFVLMAGDIVQSASDESFEWYIDKKNSSYIKEWHEIAGNHDLKSDGGKLYKKHINKDFYYSFVKGNILFILMSDEIISSKTEISDETFEWWKNLVSNNQDKIIIVMTHAPLEGSGIPFSTRRRRQIYDSERFVQVLEKYKVDMWISGHIHVPQWFAGDIGRVDALNATIFVNVSGIREEVLGLKSSESRLISFKCKEDEVLVRSRNHTKGKYNKSLDRLYKLSKKVQCE